METGEVWNILSFFHETHEPFLLASLVHHPCTHCEFRPAEFYCIKICEKDIKNILISRLAKEGEQAQHSPPASLIFEEPHPNSQLCNILHVGAVIQHEAEPDSSSISCAVTSVPMSSICLIIIKSGNCSPFICFMIASLFSNSVKSISVEARKQSLTISASDKGLFARANVHAKPRLVVEVVLWMSFCCSESDVVNCSIFLFRSSLPGAYISLNFGCVV